MTPEWLAIMHELEHEDELQQVLAAVYLYSHLPVYELAHCTKEQINRIAAPAYWPRKKQSEVRHG